MRIALALFLSILPLTAIAHGEDVLFTVYTGTFAHAAMFVFIVLVNWRIVGMLVLFSELITSGLLTFFVLYQMPFNKNEILITGGSIVLPIISVIGTYLIFRKKFIRPS